MLYYAMLRNVMFPLAPSCDRRFASIFMFLIFFPRFCGRYVWKSSEFFHHHGQPTVSCGTSCLKHECHIHPTMQDIAISQLNQVAVIHLEIRWWHAILFILNLDL